MKRKSITYLTRKIIHYNYVKRATKQGKFKYNLVERIIAKILSKYYTYKWEHYFDKEGN